MLAPGTLVGRYVIKRKLAEGGMAEIFLAAAVGPEGFSKDVVIKVVRSFLATDSQFVQMFIAEARLASKLDHANVVQIFDFGKHGDSYYLAMEYVRGTSLWDLKNRCREQGVPFPPILAAEIGAQVARGLQHAHAQSAQRPGLVHRDVTPHNVLLSFDGAVKLTDFGIAKATTSHTAPGMLKGKFGYMSPEQSRGDKVDARTDIFALGIVVWELLTGGRLFDGESDVAVLRAVQESLIPPPSRLNPDVPAELSQVVMKALARPLEERFQTAFEMEKALANYVLRNAKSVDDAAISLFVQQMYREEFEAADPALGEAQSLGDDFGSGPTHTGKKIRTITATPVGPAPSPPAELESRPVDSLTVEDGDGPTLRSEEPKAELQATPAGARTKQIPLNRPSRRFEPLPVGEPSITVRPSVEIPEEASASQTEPAPADVVSEAFTVPRSNVPLIVMLGTLVIGLLIAVAYVWSVDAEQASHEVPTPVPEPMLAAEGFKEPVALPEVPAQPLADAPPLGSSGQLDAALPPLAEAGLSRAKSVVADTSPAHAPAARKMGTLSIKAVPYATVLVQGRSYEVTGVQKVPAPTGTYEITLIHPKRTAKQRVTVQPSETTSVSFAAE